jgi:hypothetical protein
MLLRMGFDFIFSIPLSNLLAKWNSKLKRYVAEFSDTRTKANLARSASWSRTRKGLRQEICSVVAQNPLLISPIRPGQ